MAARKSGWPRADINVYDAGVGAVHVRGEGLCAAIVALAVIVACDRPRPPAVVPVAASARPDPSAVAAPAPPPVAAPAAPPVAPQGPGRVADVPGPVADGPDSADVSPTDASPPEALAPCIRIDRGAEQRRPESLGKTIAELEDSGGRVACGGGRLWQLHFGTTCGDRASFHRVLTVELRAGRVRRAWQRREYNDSFCGPLDD